MKKLLLTSLAIIFSLFILSCSNDDDNNNLSNDLIVGKWFGVSSTFNGNPSGVPDSSPIEFNSNGKVTFTYLGFGTNGEDITESGTWTKNGNDLVISWDDADPGLETTHFEITELSSNTLKWNTTADNFPVTETYSK